MAEKNKEFRAIVYGKFDSESELARKLSWTRQKVNKITNGNKIPDLEELDVLSVILERPIEELAYIFLRKESPNEQQNKN